MFLFKSIYFYGGASIIIGLLLLGFFVMLLKDPNKDKIKKQTIGYLITSIILIIVGTLSLFSLFKYSDLICICILVATLLIFVIFLTIEDKKGKKTIKLKTVKTGKTKKLVNKDEDI